MSYCVTSRLIFIQLSILEVLYNGYLFIWRLSYIILNRNNLFDHRLTLLHTLYPTSTGNISFFPILLLLLLLLFDGIFLIWTNNMLQILYTFHFLYHVTPNAIYHDKDFISFSVMVVRSLFFCLDTAKPIA